MVSSAFLSPPPCITKRPESSGRSLARRTCSITSAVRGTSSGRTNDQRSPALYAAAASVAAALTLATPILPYQNAQVLAAGAPRDVYADALLRATPGAPVADLANVFGKRQEEALARQLADIETMSGVKVRVLTQTIGSAPGSVIKDFFGLDDMSVLIVADLRGGNILNFNVGKGVSARLRESFWIELGNRYGGKFYVRDNGEDGAVLAAIDGISKCLSSRDVCVAVPGFGRDQFVACAACAVVGGSVAGAAARTGGKKFNASWFLLFSPLWGIFFVSFGLLPVVSREGFASLDAAGIFLSFAAAASATWTWIPLRFGESGAEKTTPDV
jgi:hypothetical protein